MGWRAVTGATIKAVTTAKGCPNATIAPIAAIVPVQMIQLHAWSHPAVLAEFTESFPRLKTPLIDERDQFLAQKIKEAPGKKIVAVLGAAHVPGITKEIYKHQDLEKLSAVPPKSILPKIIGWSIPVLLIALVAFTFIANPTAGWDQAWSWNHNDDENSNFKVKGLSNCFYTVGIR